jgi:hypothetical protein
MFALCSTPAGADDWKQEYEQDIDGFKFQFRYLEEDKYMSVDVSKSGRNLLHKVGDRYFLVSLDDIGGSYGRDLTKPVVVKDLNGDGVNDVIIQHWTTGAHCCYTYEIYTLDKQFKKIWHNDAGNGHLDVMTFRPQGGAVLEVGENAFTYWRTGFAQSPMPPIKWVWDKAKGRFKIDLALMKEPVDKPRFDRIKNQPFDYETEKLFVELIYSGNRDAAMDLMAGVPEPERTEFLKSFAHRFRKSKHFAELSPLLKGGRLNPGPKE